jgi:hypothetical protein
VESLDANSAQNVKPGSCLQLVVKECLLASEMMLQEEPRYGSIQFISKAASEKRSVPPTAALKGRITRNRELAASMQLARSVTRNPPV